MSWALLLLALSWSASVHARSKFWERLLDFIGVTDGPGQIKSAADVAQGRLFTKDLVSGAERPLTAEAGFRWPVFSLDGRTVHALRGDELVTIDVASARALPPHRKLAKVEKLVGVDRSQRDRMLVLLKDAAVPIGVLSLKSGKVTPLPFDPRDAEQARALGRLSSDERAYGDDRIFVQKQSKATLSGTSEWQEIYLQSGAAPAHPISSCAGASCGQPALSVDGKQAVWVRTGS
jgi:hypothetical protein